MNAFRLLLCALAFATGAHAAPATWTIRSLGFIGAKGNFAQGINNAGDVVGYGDSGVSGGFTGTYNHGFIWSGGTMRDAGTPSGQAAANSELRKINDAGVAIGIADGYAYLWRQGAWTAMGFAGEPQGINATDAVAGYYSAGAGYRGFVYANGTFQPLGTLGGTQSRAMAINDAGLVVGDAFTAGNLQHAFAFQNNVMRDLGTLGGATSRATDVNNAGQIVGVSDTGSGSVAFISDGTTMRPLIDTTTNAFPVSINAMGWVVGTLDDNSASFLYRNGVLTRLEEMPEVQAAGWTRLYPQDINDHGWITGSGRRAGSSVNESFVLIPPRNNVRDFDASGTSDVVWRRTDGTQVLWLMSGTREAGGLQLVGPGSAWTVVRTADFDGNGTADILWQHTDGTIVMFLMDGTEVTGSATLQGAGTGWTPQLTGDLDGDGKADIVWRNTDGRQYLWLMDGTTIKAGTGLVGAGSGWTVKQLVDLDGDGKDDILWQHADGTVIAWLMDGTTQVTSATLVGAGGWSPIQVGDLDGDGKGDILWRHTDGTVIAWLMDGTTQITSRVLVGAGPWTVSHVGDFNGDGKTDLLWRNTSDGTVIAWLMDGTTPTGPTPTLVGAGSGWSVRTVADYDGDGNTDIVWQHADGTTVVWLMQGTTPFETAQWVPAGSGWSVMP